MVCVFQMKASGAGADEEEGTVGKMSNLCSLSGHQLNNNLFYFI